MFDWLVIAITLAIAIGSLLLFAATDAVPALRVGIPMRHPLWWDAGLSLLFFVQHSGMVRRGFQKRLAAVVPPQYHRAVYAIASGVVLAAVAIFWQPTQPPLFVLTGAVLWASRLLAAAAALLFLAAVIPSRFDFFGVQPIRRQIRGEPEEPPRFVARGAYAWVRHPLYACVIVLLWCAPLLTADRLLLNVLWTMWIVVATFLEERDLVSDFGDVYRDYRRRVPMLIPWRGRVTLPSSVPAPSGSR